MDSGNLSSPLSTVDPVVVRPDIASKYASVNERSGSAIINGNAPDADINTHESVTRMKPSRAFSSRRLPRVASATLSPMIRFAAAA